MKSDAIVTLADSNYFELLIELISSIKNFNQSKNISICVLDAGLSSDQVSILKEKVDEVKKANWDIEVSKLKAIGKEWFKSQVSRAFLPEYFPNYDKYLWVMPSLPFSHALKYSSIHSHSFTHASQSIQRYLS